MRCGLGHGVGVDLGVLRFPMIPPTLVTSRDVIANDIDVVSA